jgi:hypothetical protein
MTPAEPATCRASRNRMAATTVRPRCAPGRHERADDEPLRGVGSHRPYGDQRAAATGRTVRAPITTGASSKATNRVAWIHRSAGSLEPGHPFRVGGEGPGPRVDGDRRPGDTAVLRPVSGANHVGLTSAPQASALVEARGQLGVQVVRPTRMDSWR